MSRSALKNQWIKQAGSPVSRPGIDYGNGVLAMIEANLRLAGQDDFIARYISDGVGEDAQPSHWRGVSRRVHG